MNFGDEIENTKGLIEEIEYFGVNNLDNGDYEIIKYFVDNLEPYLNTVDMNINLLELKIEDTYSKQDEIELKDLTYKSKELSHLIPTLKNYMSQIKISA
ncbi:hypothetical protein [Mammaliicoccus sciuri]|uniref:hypothetical protein n=1 Tax=Mammaliicoccus sciuri TaxID=1296 RepID=UPI0021CF7ED6|nr:hypothetical protein [Mammaliicoccus sciuri]UXU70216.1 hypothetical protein MUA36_05905 [Mammaliicoccus sciuri]